METQRSRSRGLGLVVGLLLLVGVAVGAALLVLSSRREPLARPAASTAPAAPPMVGTPPPALAPVLATPEPAPSPEPSVPEIGLESRQVESPRRRVGEARPVQGPPSAAAAPPPAPPPILTRGGARRVGAIRDQYYYVNYDPQGGLLLARLDQAIAGKSLAFEVMPFEQDDFETVPGGFYVARPGEMVSAAIALQLDSMGYEVGLELVEALASLQERLGDRFKIDLARFAYKATFSGKVRFFVVHARQAERYETKARLEVAVVVSGLGGADSEFLYQREIQETETAVDDKLEGASDRARNTAATVLKRFVKTLLGDPRLEQALVSYVSYVRAPVPAAPELTINEEPAVRHVIADYERAIEQKDLVLYRRLKPNLSDAEESRLRQALAAIEGHDVQIIISSVLIEGSQATVRLTRKDTVKGRPQPTFQQTIVLVKGPDGWTIREIGQ